jgi:hypothetical protein
MQNAETVLGVLSLESRMIGKPSSPVRREAARKRTSPGLEPRCAADPSAHWKNWKIVATGYRARLAELPNIIRIVTTLEYWSTTDSAGEVLNSAPTHKWSETTSPAP